MIDEQWVTEVLRPLLKPQPDVAEELLDTTIVVFSADTDRTQSYVFESDKLPEIRGASRLLAALNRGDKWVSEDDPLWFSAIERIFEAHGIPSDCLLYAEGGSILALLPDISVEGNPLAQLVADELKRTYLDVTLGVATITVEWRPFSLRELLHGITMPPQSSQLNPIYQARIKAYRDVPAGREHFGETVLLMASLMRRAKQHRPQPLVERLPFAQICRSCRRRPAETVAYAEDRSPWPLCAACETKRRWGGVQERSYWFERLTSKGLTMEPALYPEDMEQIDNGREVAIVYADGDGIGARLQELPTPEAYKRFSKELSTVTEQAVIAALTDAGLYPYQYRLPEDAIRTVHPWEILTIGGDDVMVALRAASAMKFARVLVESFRELASRNAALGRYSLTMSAGLAVGKVKTPVRLLREAAAAALKNAKRRANEVGEPCIDYHNFVTEGQPGQNMIQWRRDTNLVGDGMLTARPYPLSDFARMMECLNLLASVQFPRAQLHILADSLRRSFNQGQILYYYQRARLRPELREELYRIEKMWGADPDMWPWRAVTESSNDAYRYDSVLIDIASAYDFYKPDRND